MGGFAVEKEQPTQTYPDMSQLDFDDVVRVLMGVPPEGEEVVIYEDEEDQV